MKVLMLINRLNVGGTETYILSLAIQLRIMGISVAVATRGGPLAALFRRTGIPVHLVPFAETGRAAGFIQRLVRQHKYHVLHAHDSLSFRWNSGMGVAGGLPPTVLTLHGKYLSKAALKKAAALARNVVAVSPEMVNWALHQGIPQKKIHMIPNGINTLFFKPESNRDRWKTKLNLTKFKPVVVYAGRFQNPKHLVAKSLIEAAPLIAQVYPGCGIVLAGPGPFLAQMRRWAAAANTALGRECVVVWPAMKDVRQLYWAGDLVVGTGRVAMEAMACGKPVVAVGVSGYSGPVTPASMERSIRFNFGDHRGMGPAGPQRSPPV